MCKGGGSGVALVKEIHMCLVFILRLETFIIICPVIHCVYNFLHVAPWLFRNHFILRAVICIFAVSTASWEGIVSSGSLICILNSAVAGRNPRFQAGYPDGLSFALKTRRRSMWIEECESKYLSFVIKIFARMGDNEFPIPRPCMMYLIRLNKRLLKLKTCST